jgi:hypothetical protein
MAGSVGFVPGTLIRWRKRCFVVVDCDGMDTIIAQEYGKGGFERIPISEALPGQGPRSTIPADRIVAVHLHPPTSRPAKLRLFYSGANNLDLPKLLGQTSY